MPTPPRLISIAGQIGWDHRTRQIPRDLIGQAAQALDNLLPILAEAGGGAAQLTRLTCYFTHRDEFKRHRDALESLLQDVLGEGSSPARSFLFVCGLVAPGSRIEIEGTALLAAA